MGPIGLIFAKRPLIWFDNHDVIKGLGTDQNRAPLGLLANFARNAAI